MIAEKPSFAAPLLTWLLLQLVAIAFAAARVKLWAKSPVAGETMALDELIVVQFVASSLLFPFLCRDARSTVAVIVASWPMIALAGYLSFHSLSTSGMTTVNLSLWLAGLGMWGKVAMDLDRPREGKAPAGPRLTITPACREHGSPTTHLIFVAICGTVNIAGPIAAYLGAETNGRFSGGFWTIPLLAAVRISHFPSIWNLLPTVATLMLSLCAAVILRASLSTRVMH